MPAVILWCYESAGDCSEPYSFRRIGLLTLDISGAYDQASRCNAASARRKSLENRFKRTTFAAMTELDL